MDQILISYYENNAKRLRAVVNRILAQFGGFSSKDTDDFYSLANEVFADVLKRYDGQKPFDSFLYCCLANKIKSEMTKRNRRKRKADELSVPLDAPFGEEELTLADILPGDFNLEREVLGEEGERSQKLERYLNALSMQERRVLELLADSYKPKEIQRLLHISKKEYQDALAGIHTYENISLLF